MLTHESKKPEAEPKSDEIPMLIEEVSMNQSIGQIYEPSEVKENPNEDTTSIEEDTLPVDQGTKEKYLSYKVFLQQALLSKSH